MTGYSAERIAILPFVPFPFFVSVLMLLIFFNVLKQTRDSGSPPNIAFLLLILCSVFVTVVMRVFRVKLSDIAK